MKAYLGDGVYVDYRGGMLVLTAENGLCATDTIYLEDEVYAALLGYVERLKQQHERASDENSNSNQAAQHGSDPTA